jgi:hypothetical protein
MWKWTICKRSIAFCAWIFVTYLSDTSLAFIAPSSSNVVVRRSATNLSVSKLSSSFQTHLSAKRRNNYDDQDYYEYYDDDNEEEEYYEDYEPAGRRRRRRPRNPLNQAAPSSNLSDIASPFGTPKGMRLPDSVSQALLAGVFVLGIGTGVTVDSQINTSPKDLASRDAIDQAAPNPRVCSTYGASAMAFDQRVFVSFNPFNVYVAQADVKPACVLRPSNVVPVLQDKGLINDKEVRACKQNMNTWAFVGDLNDYPQLSCVYKSEDAQNEFLSNPKYGIGEDVWDDDREAIKASASGKKIKDNLTEGEKDNAAKAAKLKRDILSMEAAASLGKDVISNI